MPQLIRLITLSHIYAGANNKVGRQTERGGGGAARPPQKVAIRAISEKKH